MATWDDEDFNPEAVNGHVTLNQWDGEDEEDDDLKDNWDDDEEEKEKVVVSKPEPKKKKNLADIIKEKEEKKRQEYLANQEKMKNNVDEDEELTPEEEIEEKLRRQKMQEEADLEIARETFGVPEPVAEVKTIDNFIPATKEDFQELGKMVVQKFSSFELRADYPIFLETIIRDCCAGVEPEDIKKISNTLNLLVQEKQKLSKVGKGKKKTAGASKKTLSTGKGTKKDEMDYDDSYYNEYEDFM